MVAGCDDSENPLSNRHTSKPDNRLVGVWRHGDVSYRIGHAGEDFPNDVLRVVEVTHSHAGAAPAAEYLAFPTVLGKNTYLNVMVTLFGDGQDKPFVSGEEQWKSLDSCPLLKYQVSYLILKYQVDGNNLLVWGMDGEAKKRAIESGKIKGELIESEFRFTDTSENLARFVVEAGDSLWNTKKPVRLERVTTHPRMTEGSQTTPTPPLRPMGSKFMVDN
jgi:hypothetical protein